VRILAIDPAQACGWAFVDTADGAASAISGAWDLSTRRDESAGMKLLRLETKLVDVAKTGVDLVVYETPALHSYALAVISHAKFIGVIERFCTRHRINYRGYAPTEIKKFATGKGNAGKPEMIKAARERWGYAGDDNNEADALCILHLAVDEYVTNEPPF
jgi:Holliday junction resolvasome RuvABC endonuclease subunit